MRSHREWTFQEIVYRYLCSALPPHAYVTSVDSGTADPVYVKVARRRRGILPGFPDMLVLLDARLFTWELKAGDRWKLSDDQKSTGASFQRNGATWFVVHEKEGLARIEADLRTLGIEPAVTADTFEALDRLAKPKKKKSRIQPAQPFR